MNETTGYFLARRNTISSMDSPDIETQRSKGINFDDLPTDEDIPDYIKKHNAVLRFPDKLMLMLTFVERESAKRSQIPEKACIAWTRDGTAFIIRNREELVNNYLPRIFHIHKSKFASFTRKLYRWGFRQVILRATEDRRTTKNDKIFVHEDFQRDQKHLLANMKSITAEGTRRSHTSLGSTSVHSVDSPLIHEIGRTTLKKAIFSTPLSLQEHEMLLNSLPALATQSPTTGFQRAPSFADAGSCVSSLPLFSGIVEHQPGVAASLLPSASRSGFINLALRPPPYPLEPLLHPVVHSALLLGRQRQQAEDVARARQYLATFLERSIPPDTFY